MTKTELFSKKNVYDHTVYIFWIMYLSFLYSQYTVLIYKVVRKKLACPINYKYVHQYEYPWLHVQYMFNHLYIPNVLYMNMYTCIFNSTFATRHPSSWVATPQHHILLPNIAMLVIFFSLILFWFGLALLTFHYNLIKISFFTLRVFDVYMSYQIRELAWRI